MIFSFDELKNDLEYYKALGKLSYRICYDGLIKVSLFVNGTFLKNLYYAPDDKEN